MSTPDKRVEAVRNDSVVGQGKGTTADQYSDAKLARFFDWADIVSASEAVDFVRRTTKTFREW